MVRQEIRQLAGLDWPISSNDVAKYSESNGLVGPQSSGQCCTLDAGRRRFLDTPSSDP